MNDRQLEAVKARGEVFVSAGAGTGKTSVLVSRFVRAVCDMELSVDSVLVITYTRKAAGELRTRIRAALVQEGKHELARSLDSAWISTIHGFCSRLLRAHPFEVGIDPRFRELDDEGGAVIRGEAFAKALDRFCADEDADHLRLLATYTADGLRRRLIGVFETLRSAGRDLVLEPAPPPQLASSLAELRLRAGELAADPEATELQRAVATAALDLPNDPEALCHLGPLLARGARAQEFEAARKAVERDALETVAARDRLLLQELLTLFAEEYAAAKARESVVDFEDLQLLTRDLLRNAPEVRAVEQLRFRAIMVDEFQDTNELQTQIIDLLRQWPDGSEIADEKDVFYVGDEFQSIYGFRHADVEVFRRRREAAKLRLPLSENYRSRAEVLAAVNHLFAGAFGEGFQELAASREFPDPVFGHPVELLVTDKDAYKGTGTHWRRAEAANVAQRVRQLVDDGAAEPGDVVLLFAAGTDAEQYEEELRKLGLPTYRAMGRRYFGQQQVSDLLMYLRLIWNRYDDVALASVLMSPFVGVSNDAMLLVRRHAGRRPIFTGIERSLPEPLSEEDERLIRAFKQRFERLVSASARVSLERLCELIVAEHDYDLAVLARWDGGRRYANMRKLMRLARGYEELRGRDVEGFVRFLRDQQSLGASQLEAVSEEEGAGAVRLMTIHAAKGLEFKVVVVADAGRDTGTGGGSEEIVALPDGRIGMKIPHPSTGKPEPVAGWDAVKEARDAANQAERLRLYYVAMTRAQERLIVSGSLDERRDTPIGWVIEQLDCEAELEGATEPFELERDGAMFLVSVQRAALEDDPDTEPEAPELDEVATADQLSLFAALPDTPAPRGYVLPEIVPIPTPPLHSVRRLSYSSIASFERCSYRYYAERVGGLRERRAIAVGVAGLAATEIGDAVHRLLEVVDLSAPAAPPLDPVSDWYPDVSEAELERIDRFVRSYCESDLARRIATLPGVMVERPFAFEHDGVLFHGRLDVLQRDGGKALILDYKTNILGERDPAVIVDHEYSIQRVVYALACFKAGADDVEIVYHFLERPDAVVRTRFDRSAIPELEARLSVATNQINAGPYEPRPSDFNCAGCPALDLVCAGPKLLGGSATSAISA
ncbi:unannotated protein [freshwater metagenome]|uniref:DNA 3'-5' helicase n=1 Tax=freshwater metagenome TaxID=449393 RepID=A0A6J6P504_9ZZZZ